MFAAVNTFSPCETRAASAMHLSGPIEGMTSFGSVQAAVTRGTGTAPRNPTIIFGTSAAPTVAASPHPSLVLPAFLATTTPHANTSPDDSFCSSRNDDSGRDTATPKAASRFFTHTPYATNVIGAAAEPSDFAVVDRRKGSTSATGSDSRSPASSASSEGGHTPRSNGSAVSQKAKSSVPPAAAALPIAKAAAPGCEHIGRIEQLARTAHGCTTLQNMLKSATTDPQLRAAIASELRPHFHTLLFDPHAAYVVRVLISQMSRDDAVRTVATLCADAEFLCALCTTSLHSRRVVQFFLELLTPAQRSMLIAPICHAQHLVRLALSEHGCVSIQRILDVALPGDREAVLDVVRECLHELAKHQHGNYVVQYMLRHGDVERNSRAVVAAFAPRVVDIACDKFASNVLEKAFDLITPAARAMLVDALYASPQWQLQRLLCDGVGNYIVQASIAHCNAQQIGYVYAQLSPLLPLVAYGSKIDAKLHTRAQQLAAMSTHRM